MNFNMKEPQKRKGVIRVVQYIQCWDDNNGIFAYIKTNCPVEVMVHEWETFKSETNNRDYAIKNHRWDFNLFKKRIESIGYGMEYISTSGSMDCNILKRAK
ncbi:hypothetical protein C4A76_12515 [Brevibacillus laterosporus]|uniref:hypothetical protein n=1 Tax=Brevibacillus laterosporus TaxID=1465 RepID=UPI000CE3D5F3|nr:hypothetical protein [Brevibacillus laterosporus]PPA87155.1 hypothetical protein C4A76_12515 [Brevibacillus laterosporus]